MDPVHGVRSPPQDVAVVLGSWATADALASVLAHLPAPIQRVICFAAITGWRIASEVLPLEWRQVDFAAGEVRLDPGTTKNREGRTFPLTADLRAILEAQRAAPAASPTTCDARPSATSSAPASLSASQ